MLSDVEKVLWAQATEDTGRSIVDSGDYYGRKWQSNLRKGEPQEMCKYTVDDNSITVKISTVLYLAERLKLPKKNNRYKQAKKVVDLINEHGYHNAPPLVGEYLRSGGKRRDIGVSERRYTYNNDSDLDQLVQFFCIEVDVNAEDGGTCYIAVQLHNGCDIRGGLTDAVLYEAGGEFDHMLRYGYSSDIDRSTLVMAYLPDDGRCCLSDGDNQWYRNGFSSDFKDWRLETYDGPVTTLADYEYVTDGSIVPGKLCLKDGVLYSPLNSKPMEVSYAGS